MTAEEPATKQARRRGDFFGISALASALLSGLAGDKLSQSLDSGGWVSVVGFSLTIGFALIWAVYNAPVGLRRYRRWRAGRPAEPSELHTAAEEAEQWLLSLGSDAGRGMAAAEWFELNEFVLRDLLEAEKEREANADDIARICDALEVWYVRRQEAAKLLELSDYLQTVADGSGREDLAELAEARAATAYRLKGDLVTASKRLGNSNDIAQSWRGRGRTGPALSTRRELERGLLHLAKAELAPAGNDRNEAVQNARNRLDDALMRRPGTDLAAEVAIQINLAVVCLYEEDPESALDQLRPAVAKASASGDASGQAHALELSGVAAWMQRNPKEAKQCWKNAEHLYSEIGETEGQARCLQHLGSADLVANLHDEARKHLEKSATLRGGEAGHPTLTRYLEAARASTTPSADDTPPPKTTKSRLHRLLTRWLN